jgi:hypothetical protein
LTLDNIDISKPASQIINRYIELLRNKDAAILQDLEELKTFSNVTDKIQKLVSILSDKTEARIFEIISYAVLKNHYKNTIIYWGENIKDIKDLQKENLSLYKTGRTNANDGGIDFVMRPLGRFFQVTEVLENYNKYLLDIDKVIHFPVTFVVKTKKTKEGIEAELQSYIEKKSGGMDMIKNRYKDAIEEIITINELEQYVGELMDDDINSVISDIEMYYKFEMNLA